MLTIFLLLPPHRMSVTSFSLFIDTNPRRLGVVSPPSTKLLPFSEWFDWIDRRFSVMNSLTLRPSCSKLSSSLQSRIFNRSLLFIASASSNWSGLEQASWYVISLRLIKFPLDELFSSRKVYSSLTMAELIMPANSVSRRHIDSSRDAANALGLASVSLMSIVSVCVSVSTNLILRFSGSLW